MTKKILAFFMAFLLSVFQPALIFAESTDAGEIAQQLGLTDKQKVDNPEETYKKFTCPSCEREFEIRIDPNDFEMKKGIKKITCPYDGTVFYPQASIEKEQELQYEEIRCPNCGREFKSYIDVKALLAGQPQLLTCPYDKKKFYFKAESFKPAVFTWANLQTVICPTDKRTFRAYIDPNNPRELVCPYDGTKFFPTPELIVSQSQAGISASGAGSGTPLIMEGGSMAELSSHEIAENIVAPQTIGIAPSARATKLSRIEEMFSEHIPLSVSTAIKQFGYDIFKPVEKIKTSKEAQEESKESQGENKLLKTLLASRQGGGILPGESDLEGGLSTFASPTDIPVIGDYLLGPGDTLRVSIWGQVQEIFPITIDAEGKVLLPKVGPLYLWGMKFSDAENLIKESLLKAYTNIQVSVSIGRIRGIKVFVLGETQKPGAYTVSALSNAFHALYAAGGPTKLGSMRNIKLMHKNSPDLPIDLYNMLLSGDNTQDYKVHANDIIFIPPIGDVVGVAGNVKRPAIYELKGKIKLSDVLEMAGGISAVGYLQRIQLERIQEHLRKTVLDLEFKSGSDLKNSPDNLELQDGDLILVFPITPIRYNFVSITGNILRPGDYELKQDMRIRDLIDKAGGILPGTYIKRAEIARFRSDQTREIIPVSLSDIIDGNKEADIALREWDVVTIYSKKEVLPDLFIEIDGAVNKPGKYELTENMKMSDLIFRAGGLKSNAFLPNCELFRSFSDSGSKVLNVDLNKALSKDAEEAKKNDLVLEEGDHLFIREIASKEEKFIITLSGEFKYPGKYAFEKGTRLDEVIKRAGGFTEDAFLDGAFYARDSVKIAQQKMVKKFLEFEQNALLQEQSSLAIGASPTQLEGRNKLVEYRQKLLQELNTLQVPGRILIRLNADMRQFENSEYNIVIEDKDTFYIPPYPATVQVVGNVYGPGTVTYAEGKGCDYYINKVGGLTKAGDLNAMFLIRANGETVSNFARAIKIKRGDTIIIPQKIEYKTLPGLFFKDIAQTIYQLSLGAIVTIVAINSL